MYIKNLILFVLLFISVKLTAQTKDSITKKEVYLEISIVKHSLNLSHIFWEFNVISGSKYLPKDSFPLNRLGFCLKSFGNKEEIFEYIVAFNWKLFNTYTLETNNNSNVYYIFKKEI